MVAEHIISDALQPDIWRHSPHGNYPNRWVLLLARLVIRVAICFVRYSTHRSHRAASSDTERLDPNT